MESRIFPVEVKVGEEIMADRKHNAKCVANIVNGYECRKCCFLPDTDGVCERLDCSGIHRSDKTFVHFEFVKKAENGKQK